MVDAHGFRDALGRFATGVSVITALTYTNAPPIPARVTDAVAHKAPAAVLLVPAVP